MWKKTAKKFIFSFLIIAGVLTALWKFISIPYLYLLVLIAKPVWSFFDYPVQLVIKDNLLKFVYTNISTEPISFSVFQADEIYLNLVLLIALFGATWITLKKKLISQALISAGVLFIIHEIVLFAYSFSTIREYVKSAAPDIQSILLPYVNQFFPDSTAGYFDHFLFQWNAWGWDVLPLLLWLISSYKLFISKQ